MTERTHIWIFAYKDDKTQLITHKYWHPSNEELKLIPLNSDWHYRLLEEECDCEEVDSK